MRCFDNVIAASGLKAEQARQYPNKMIVPDKLMLSPGDMAAVYFSRTPFLPLFSMPVPFAIPQMTRFEHTHVVGGTGHGKDRTVATVHHAHVNCADQFQGLDEFLVCVTIGQ